VVTAFGPTDRLLWVWLSRFWSGWRSAIVNSETVIAWHRKGLPLYWFWKSHLREVRPAVSPWGAPRIHGELLKLGIQVSQTTVAKYMVRRRRPPSQTGRTFSAEPREGFGRCGLLRGSVGFFDLLFLAFLILPHGRRRVVHYGVTAHPTAEWAARRLLEAFPWDSAPRYLLRGRAGSYGQKFAETANWVGVREVLTAPQSPGVDTWMFIRQSFLSLQA
jgi:putative transposase